MHTPPRSTGSLHIAGIVALVVGTMVVTVPAAVAATTASSAISCVDPTVFDGQSYCPGYIVGVRNGVYGTGARVVLNGVTVVQSSTRGVTVEGGPSCLQDPTEPPVWCGQTIPTLTVTFPRKAARPGVGTVINLYGVTQASSLAPTGYTTVGYCSPDFGC